MFIKTKILNALPFKNTVSLPLSYWILAAVRIIYTLLPQYGYIHPDEFFQNVEIIAGDVFNIAVSRPWEFNPTFPVRNILIPQVVLRPPLLALKYLDPYARLLLGRPLLTPYFLLVVPRLVICLLSFINDYCLYKMCVILGQNYKTRLNIFASSYVVLVYSCRSFSNSFEMIFFSILMLLVSESVFNSDKIIYHEEFLMDKYDQMKSAADRTKIFKLQKRLPSHSLSHVFWISTVTTLGVFNRPSFMAFAIVPLFFWAHRGLGTRTYKWGVVHWRLAALVICALPAMLALVAADSWYYGYVTLGEIGAGKVSWASVVLTPVNFVRYNADPANLRRHGLHARYTHMLWNLPLLYNVLAALPVWTLLINIYRWWCGGISRLPRIWSVWSLLWWSAIGSVAALSIVKHQEARFLLPILIPLVAAHGGELHSSKFLITLWTLFNVTAAVFYGSVHQAGVVKTAGFLHEAARGDYNRITVAVSTHSYSIPSYIVMRRNNLSLLRLGGRPPSHAVSTLLSLERHAREEKRKVQAFFVSPSVLESRVLASVPNYIRFIEEKSFWPHYCTEALPEFPGSKDRSCLPNYAAIFNNRTITADLSFIDRISCFLNKFSLKVYRVTHINATITKPP